MRAVLISLLCVSFPAYADASTLNSADMHLVEKVSKEIMASGEDVDASAHRIVGNEAENMRTLSVGQINGMTSDIACLMRLGGTIKEINGYLYALLLSTGEASTMINSTDRDNAIGFVRLSFVQAAQSISASKLEIQDTPPMYPDSSICQIKSDELLRAIGGATNELDPMWKKLGSPPI